MENNELQDILLDKSADQKSGKVRKILVSIAILALLFIAVLMFVKFMNSDPVSEPTLPPSPQPAPITPSPSPLASESFEQVPVSNEPSFDKIVEDYKANIAKTEAELPPPPPPPVEDISVPEPAKPDIKPEPVKPAEPAAKPEPSKPKPAKTASKPAVVTPVGESDLAKGSYIQVASPSKINTKDPFLIKLATKGYQYHIYEAKVNGKKVSKVLIGPFSGKALEQNMAKIRSEIAPGAFVFRVK